MLHLAAFFLLQAVVTPAVSTQPVATDPDDPAIWVNARSPNDSLIFGTDKAAAPKGGVYAFGLDGKIRQHVGDLNRPNNCDVTSGFRAGSDKWDLLVVTERLAHRLRIFRIGSEGELADVTGETQVFSGASGEPSEPMGISCYVKGAQTYAFVSPKSGPTSGYLGQYELTYNVAAKKVDAALVRRFGTYSGKKEIESIAVDNKKGLVYYSDERVGTRLYHADASAGNDEIAFFNRKGTLGDHEGIAIWGGYVVCTDQIDGNSRYRVFDQSALGDDPLTWFTGGADATDGIEICDQPLGPRFPEGIFVAMNSGGRNFLIYDLRDIRAATKLPISRP